MSEQIKDPCVADNDRLLLRYIHINIL